MILVIRGIGPCASYHGTPKAIAAICENHMTIYRGGTCLPRLSHWLRRARRCRLCG